MAALKPGGAIAHPTPASEFLPGTPFWAPTDPSDASAGPSGIARLCPQRLSNATNVGLFAQVVKALKSCPSADSSRSETPHVALTFRVLSPQLYLLMTSHSL